MADDKEREEYLQQEVDQLEEELKKLAGQMGQLAEADCSFGTCVFDPSMDTVEKKIEDVQKRKKMVQAMMKSLSECENA